MLLQISKKNKGWCRAALCQAIHTALQRLVADYIAHIPLKAFQHQSLFQDPKVLLRQNLFAF